MTENKIIKNLLENCQDYQRRVNEIEAILLKYHNVNIEEKYWLTTFNTESATACFTAAQELKNSLHL